VVGSAINEKDREGTVILLNYDGFKGLRGYMTEGHYLVFAYKGYALTNDGVRAIPWLLEKLPRATTRRVRDGFSMLLLRRVLRPIFTVPLMDDT
jgi:hypothetical protein